jgi:hypothetical protein
MLPAALAAQKKDLTFHASFNKGLEADFAKGDKRIHTATSYAKREDTKPGLHHPDVEIAKGAGKFGDALRFKKKNVKAVYYAAEGNVPFDEKGWTGTISFWLSLDPETDLEPGFCDPIQVTDAAYNDSAIWVDFTKDDKPRHFRLGVFGDLAKWNPQNTPSDKNPAFNNRLVVVRKYPFAKGQWTHVAIAHQGLGSGKGIATLYLNGQKQGSTETIGEGFSWDMAKGAIRLGVNYVGLFDELSIFRRALSDREVLRLYRAKKGF